MQERLPINPDNDDLFDACSDGMLLIHIINHIEKDAIDMRTVNKGSDLNTDNVRENLKQAFTVAKTLIKDIEENIEQSILDKTPYLMFGVRWQLVRLLSMKAISLTDCPEIFRLKNDGEELADLLKLKAEQILVRWMNFHLRAAGQPEISNFDFGHNFVEATSK